MKQSQNDGGIKTQQQNNKKNEPKKKRERDTHTHTRSTTQVRHLSHLDIPSISSSSTAFPFLLPLTMRHTTTEGVSAQPCSRASTHAMAAMGDGVVGVGRGSNRREEEEEEEAQHLTHSHMYHLLLVCAGVACRWRRTWAAGDDGDEHE